ncbi:MAG: LCP family protein [Anaerostipes sp.]|nr:LCP family protein [Anaerostipes sp.]MDD3746104.1 LCP family protein [Anaerostipes sp.]
MARRVRGKTGAGAIILRILVVIILMAIFGVVSFIGSKAFFANRFKKDKKAEIAEQLKKESKEHVDITLTRVDTQLIIRVYHNKNKQMIFVPVRKDMVLDLDSTGEELTGSTTATVEELLAKTKDMKIITKEIEKTFSISISNYERLTASKFTKMVDAAGDVNIDLSTAVSYKDKNSMTVHLTEGSNDLNGSEVLGIMTDSSSFDSESEHSKLIGELMCKIAISVKKQTLKEYKAYAKEYINAATCNYSYSDISEYLTRMHAIDDKDFTYQIIEGTEGSQGFTVDKSAVTSLFNELLSESGSGSTSTTEKSKKEKTTAKSTDSTAVSSKNVGIEIQNSTKISGLAGNWKEKLTSAGYSVDSVLNNTDGELTHTKIIVAEDGMGKDLKSYFKNPKITTGTVDSGAKICIILGTEDEI